MWSVDTCGLMLTCIYANILVLMLLMNLCHLIDVVSGYVGIDDIFDLIYWYLTFFQIMMERACCKDQSLVILWHYKTFQNLRNQIMTTNLWVEQFWFDHKLVSDRINNISNWWTYQTSHNHPQSSLKEKPSSEKESKFC